MSSEKLPIDSEESSSVIITEEGIEDDSSIKVGEESKSTSNKAVEGSARVADDNSKGIPQVNIIGVSGGFEDYTKYKND